MMKKILSTGIATWLVLAGSYQEGEAQTLSTYGGTMAGIVTWTAGNQAGTRAGLGMLPDGAVAPRRSRLTWAPTFSNGSAVTIASTQTALYAVPMPINTTQVRVLIPILTTNAGYTFNDMRFTVSQDWGSGGTEYNGITPDYVNPTDPNCNMGGSCWSYFTWANKGADSDFLQSCCAPVSAPMPTLVSPDPDTGCSSSNCNNNYYKLFLSDWAAINPYTSIVGANAPEVLLARIVEPAGSYAPALQAYPGDTTESGVSWTGNATLNNGYDYSTRIVAGSHETGTISSGVTAAVGPAWGYQFDGGNPGIQLLVISDSHFSGHLTTSETASPIMRAAVNLSTGSLPIYVANTGQVSFTSNKFMSMANDAIKVVRPSICVIEGWTANDTITQLGVETYLGKVFAAKKRCDAVGAKTMIMTPLPRNTLSGATLTVWQNLYQQILSFGDATSSVCDVTKYASTFSGGIATGVWNTNYSTDGIHNNDVGALALTAPFTTCLKNMAGLN